jgi:single-strand DNA-binding protein
MSSIDTNSVFLTGRLGADPELKKSATGAPYVRLSLAVHKPTAEKTTQTQWYRVMVWGNQAEHCSNFLKRGASILVVGHLDAYSYENNGAKKNVVQVVGERVQFLTSAFRASQAEKEADMVPEMVVPSTAVDQAVASFAEEAMDLSKDRMMM